MNSENNEARLKESLLEGKNINSNFDSLKCWKRTILGEITTWSSGGTPSKSNKKYWNGDIPWISAVSMKTSRLNGSVLNITEEGLRHGSRLAQRGDVLLLVRGSELHKRIPVCIAMRSLAFNQDVKSLKVKTGILPEYLFYWMQSNNSLILSKVEFTGIGAGKLDTEVMKRLAIDLPSIKEQHAIADLFSTLDDKIELNHRINKTLEEMSQALFKRWFVEFEFPDENGHPYKSSGGEMEESELGLIPKGWDIIAFDDFILEKKEKTGERDIPEYSSTNSGLFPRSEKFKKQLSVSRSSNKVIRKNDLVFGMSRQILNWGIMFEELGAVSAAYHVFEVNQALVDSKFLELLMKNRISYFMDIIKPAAREGQGIDKNGLRKKTIYIPPMNIFEKFLRASMSLQKTIKLKTKEIETLTSLRDALLPKLMSGEIRVPIEAVSAHV
ncbi:MAG: restriction endonuclease subunit S [Negativicutes bacterium]